MKLFKTLGRKTVGILNKLKSRWGVTSNWQMTMIFIVFGITGSSALKVAAPILTHLGISHQSLPWFYWPLRVILIFFLYQFLLVVFGAIFGQFTFFWNFEKKMLARLAKPVKRLFGLFSTREALSGSADRERKE